ncbi:MAG: hypothetical protein U5K29_12180 [Acidimicrobiales bacterium]|nr:hypothetical protein [Acidimicrobiales bacterium]
MVVAPGTADEVRTEYRYDPAGRLQSTTTAASTPLAATTTYSYDAAGRLISEAGPPVGVDPSHHPVEYLYDDAGRLVCLSDESNPTPAADCDPTTGSWFYTYDEAGRVETVRDPEGVITLTEHISVGERRVTAAHGTPDAATTTYLYGRLSRLTTEISPEGLETHFGYDADGNRTTTVLGPDPADESRTTTSVFDKMGRVVEQLGPVGAVDADGAAVRSRSTTIYDKAGRLIETTEGAGEDMTRTWFRYDDAGRLRFEIVDSMATRPTTTRPRSIRPNGTRRIGWWSTPTPRRGGSIR